MYHALFHFSFFLFPPLPSFCIFALHLFQPAAKQTLPVPSIPTGGWKSSLPEIAKIIALQWYFFPSSVALYTSLLLHLFFPHSKLFFSLSSLFRELVWFQSFFWEKEKKETGENKFLTAFFSPSHRGQPGQPFWSVLVFQKCKSDPQT